MPDSSELSDFFRLLSQEVLTQFKCFDDEGEVDEASEYYITFFKAREDTVECFQPPEQLLDLLNLVYADVAHESCWQSQISA